MDLSVKSAENIQYMVEQITTKLRMVNTGAISPEHFSNSSYDDLKDIYELVARKNSFSPNEMQAIAEELGNLRK
ncbi:DUF1128 domain-containing protein [Domibacillus epiphyticus]|uniref:UPF0435 protein BTO28_04060 n=1 Tax=Domibacillus epiphyticus TaxID=1714355 RepID=A0A1V2ABG3_9BACI|nr:DUF1128 domain-containing protein [Domibacillus epiphyticus]OMP68134.1 hypothetical protein BTO28_04060 [Domibacillus epiphyticus]